MQKFRVIFQRIHGSWCFYAAVFGVIAGVTYTLISHQILCASSIWLLAALLLLIFSCFYSTRLTFLLAFAAGFIFANFRTTPIVQSAQISAEITGQVVTISGTISDDPDFSASTPVLHLDHLELQTNSTSLKLSGTLYVKLAQTTAVERSDKLLLKGKFGSAFGTFVGSLYRPELLEIARSTSGDIFARFKNFFASRVRAYIPATESSLGLSYLMGMKADLPDPLSEALRAVGMTHVVVASGAHLAILVGAVRKLFGRISRFAGLLFSLLVIFGFAAVVGFTPSMTHAALVAALGLVSGYFGRQFSPLRLISFVAALTLLIAPINLFNLGWQLSFASFFGILVFAPRLQKVLYGGKKLSWLASMLITSFSTSLICAPILIFNFGTISLLSFVANLIILPTLPYVMLAVFLTGAISFFAPFAHLVARLATFFLDFHIFVINFLSEKTVFILHLPPNDPRYYILYVPITLFLAWPALVKLAKKCKMVYNNKHDHSFRIRDA